MACAHFLPGSPAGMRTVALYSVSGMARCSESMSISLRLKSGGERRGRQAGSQAGMQCRQSGSQAGSHVYIRQDQQMMNSNQLPGCCMCACAGLSLHPFLPSLIPPPHATMSTSRSSNAQSPLCTCNNTLLLAAVLMVVSGSTSTPSMPPRPVPQSHLTPCQPWDLHTSVSASHHCPQTST